MSETEQRSTFLMEVQYSYIWEVLRQVMEEQVSDEIDTFSMIDEIHTVVKKFMADPAPVPRLRGAEADQVPRYTTKRLHDEIAKARAYERAECHARVAELEAVLKPFARIADMEKCAGPADSVMVNVARCRDARAALAASGGSIE